MSGTTIETKPRKTAAKVLVGFMVVMALLTLGSRTLENLSMAEVVVSRPSGGTLERMQEMSGSIRASGDQSIKVEDALVVSKLHVALGDLVQPGQALLTLDIEPLVEKLEQAKIDLTKKRLDFERSLIQDPNKQTPDEFLREALRSYEDGKITRSEAEIELELSLIKAQQGLDDAKMLLERRLVKGLPAAQEALALAKAERTENINEKAKAYDDAVKALQKYTDPNKGDLAKQKAELYEAYETALETHNDLVEMNKKALISKATTISNKQAEITLWERYKAGDTTAPGYPPKDADGSALTPEAIQAQIAVFQAELKELHQQMADLPKQHEKAEKVTVKAVNDAWDAYQAVANPNSENVSEHIAKLQKAIDAAKKDYDATVKTENEKVKNAQLVHDMTKKAHELFKAGTLTTLESYEMLRAEMPTEIGEIEDMLVGLEEKQKSLQDMQKDREKKLKEWGRDIEKADKDLEIAKKTATNMSKTNALDAEAERLNRLAVEQDIEKQEKLIERMQTLMDNKGEITSPVAGTIAEITAQEGSPVTEGAIVAKIAAGEKSIELIATISASDAKQLKVGLEAEMYTNNMWSMGTIKQIRKASSEGNPGNSNMYEVLFDLNDENAFKMGDTVRITVRQTSQRYYTIVPLSALREDSQGKFVFILEEQSGALGTKQIARRVEVQLLEKNATSAAVSGGLSDWDRLVERGDRPLKDGDRVRIKQ